MKQSELKRLMSAIGGLAPEECSCVKKALSVRESQVEGSMVIQERSERVEACPLCGGFRVVRNGHKDGRQRFKCHDCGKTFNALTGTPLARLRMAEMHVANARCMVEGLTVRATAEKLGVSKNTAFLWRHRFLQAIQDMKPESLSGIVEADETFFKQSYKGMKRGIPRKSHKRGTPAAKRGLSGEQVPVLVALDRSKKSTLTAVLPSRKAVDIGKELLPLVAKDSVLCSDGASAYRVIGMKAGLEVVSVPAKMKGSKSGVYHIQNVNSYDSRLKGWMFRFRGVATRYLPNYLGWHRLLDGSGGHMRGREFLTASLGG